MDLMKSELEFYSNLMLRLHVDVADILCIRDKTLQREREVILSRIAVEGISFLTKTLPLLGKAFDKALSSGFPFRPRGWKQQRGSVLPIFFGWLLNGVFDKRGYALQNANPEYVKHFRQLVYFMYKLRIPCKDELNNNVIETFKRVDRELPDPPMDQVASAILGTAAALAATVFLGFDEKDICPSHGPGSVSTGEFVTEKTVFKRIYRSVEQVYPFTEYFQFNMNHVVDSYREYENLENLDTGTAKVVLVPKDSRGPRLISCEPLELQWIQQGLGRAIVSRLETHRLTAGQVNFTDQSVNRDLALLGSKTQQWVTLDMKEASDRVSLELVKSLFRHCPKLIDALVSCRSTHTKLLDGTVIPLKKFAPMGSSLCFPVEAFCFFGLAVSVLMHVLNLTRREACKQVYVYGDDIIVKEEVYPLLLQWFPQFGLMFNTGKCCTAGFFRESCGCDAYKGIDVTPVRLRARWSHRFENSPEVLESYAALSNAAYERKYFGLSDYIRGEVVKLYGLIPYTDVPPSASDGRSGTGLSRFPSGVVFFGNHKPLSVLNVNVKKRYNRDLQRLEFMSYRAKPKKLPPLYDGYAEMLRRVNGGVHPDGHSKNSSVKGEIPGLYAVRHRSRLQRRWVYLGDAAR